MRRSWVLILLCLPLVNATPPAGAGRWHAIEYLEGQTPVTVTVNGKPRIYYRIAPGKEVAVKDLGPGRLKIVTRAETSAAAGSSISYRVSVSEGAKAVKEQVTESSVSDRSAVLEGGPALCKSCRRRPEVPARTSRSQTFR